MSNCSMISSTVAPASRFSNTADTGIRVSRNTHAPLSRPGTLSTAGHWDQSRVVAMFLPLSFLPRFLGGVTCCITGKQSQAGKGGSQKKSDGCAARKLARACAGLRKTITFPVFQGLAVISAGMLRYQKSSSPSERCAGTDGRPSGVTGNNIRHQPLGGGTGFSSHLHKLCLLFGGEVYFHALQSTKKNAMRQRRCCISRNLLPRWRAARAARVGGLAASRHWARDTHSR